MLLIAKPKIAEKFVEILVEHFEPLFNAESKKNVFGRPLGDTEWLAKNLGFLEMGKNRDQTFKLEPGLFREKLIKLLEPLKEIDHVEAFVLVHEAFADSYRDTKSDGSETIFYHLHNPTPMEMMGFTKAFPNHQRIYIVREPVQGLESWITSELPKVKFAMGFG